MDFWIFVVSVLLLLALDCAEAEGNHTSLNSSSSSPSPRSRSVPSLGGVLGSVLWVRWRPGCEGAVLLRRHGGGGSWTRPVCFGARLEDLLLGGGLCEGRRGCGGNGELRPSGGSEVRGVEVSEDELNETLCRTLTLRCQDSEERPPLDSGERPPLDSAERPPLDSAERPPLDSGERPLQDCVEPVGFRVATALLSFLLILLLLIVFCKPTVRALQTRLSNKRKNRWVGPTQSHSVSYHRGQTVNKSSDAQKHSSFPALDRLVLGTREPSSNRNSYNL